MNHVQILDHMAREHQAEDAVKLAAVAVAEALRRLSYSYDPEDRRAHITAQPLAGLLRDFEDAVKRRGEILDELNQEKEKLRSEDRARRAALKGPGLTPRFD